MLSNQVVVVSLRRDVDRGRINCIECEKKGYFRDNATMKKISEVGDVNNLIKDYANGGGEKSDKNCNINKKFTEQ